MKKYLLVFLITMLGFGILFSEVKLDVKTKFKEKFELKGIKFGVIYFLKQEGYKIVEVGEDYAIWIIDIEEEREEPDSYTIRLTVNISPPSFFKQKKPISTGDVEMEYKFNPKKLNVDDTGFLDFIKEKVENIKNKEKERAYFVGREVAKKVKVLLAGLEKESAKDI